MFPKIVQNEVLFFEEGPFGRKANNIAIQLLSIYLLVDMDGDKWESFYVLKPHLKIHGRDGDNGKPEWTQQS